MGHEALTSDRPYRAGTPVEKALARLHGDAGSAFCPVALGGFNSWLAHVGDGWALAA